QLLCDNSCYVLLTHVYRYSFLISFSFFFNPPATTDIYTLSLHDALPISFLRGHAAAFLFSISEKYSPKRALLLHQARFGEYFSRSEEHTSELQSRENLVCRLLLEKKK